MDRPTQVAVARLVKPHGLAGEIEAEPMTDFADRMAPGRELLLCAKTGETRRVTIEASRPKKRRLLLKIAGVEDVEEASKLRDCLLMIATSDLPELGPGEFYHHELLGMEVYTTKGRRVGRVTQIMRTGANDVYAVKDETGRESLIPAVSTVVREVDVARARMLIEALPGLLEGEGDED